MGTSAFGGASDISQTLAYAYAQYQDHLTSLANRADQRATDEQRAADADMIDKWQSGDVSDAEFLAYAKQRNKDSFSDPQEKEYWAKTLRAAQDTIKQRSISTTAQSILDGIQSGKNTWNDLQKFYLTQRKSLRPNDPMYKQLSDQLTQVNGQIRDNEINGGIQKAEYLFKSGQISGAQAGAMIRGLAGRYKNEDAAKYYQLLQSANDLTTFGGMYSSSGGGGGGGRRGGGGGSNSKSIKDVVDAYEATRNALLSMSDQFDKGATIGVDSSGNKYLLRNPDGTPSVDMQAMDAQAMDTFNLLGQAYTASGQDAKAEATAAAAQKFLRDKIQPRNTIGPEEQRTALLGSLKQQIDAAGNANDPVGSDSMLRHSLDGYKQWLSQLNTDRSVNPLNKVQGADAIGSPTRRDPTAPINSTTSDFVKESAQIYDALEQGVMVGASGDLSGLDNIALPAGMKATLKGMVDDLAATTQMIYGLSIPEGQPGHWGWFMDPATGLHPAPIRTVPDVNGVPVSVPVDDKGQPMLDPGQSTTIFTTAGGGLTVPAFAPVQNIERWNGAPVIDPKTNQVLVAHGQLLSPSGANSLRKQIADQTVTAQASDLASYQRVVVQGATGNPQVWFGLKNQDGTVAGWAQGPVTGDQKNWKPAIIVAPDAYRTVQIAQKLNLDPTSYYTSDAGVAQDLRRQSPDQLPTSLAGNSDPVKYGGTYATPVDHSVRGGFTQNSDVIGNDLPSSLRTMAQSLGFGGPLSHSQIGGATRGADLLPSIPKSKPFAAPDNSAWLARVRQNAALSAAALQERIRLARDSRPPVIQLPKISALPYATSTQQQIDEASQHLAGNAGGGMIA